MNMVFINVCLPVSVRPLQIRLEAPAEVAAGSKFEIRWEGPDGQRDYLTIAPAGAEPGTYRDYRYTREGSPLTLTAPSEPGAYEVRYQSDRVSGKTFASRPIQVN